MRFHHAKHKTISQLILMECLPYFQIFTFEIIMDCLYAINFLALPKKIR